METIFVQVENKSDASLIKKILSRFQSVSNIGTSKNKRLNKFIEDLEMEEDIVDYKKSLSKKQKFYTIEETDTILKKAGKL